LGINITERTVEMLKTLANPIRLKILALCLVKERSSREIREILGISKPLLIAHLRRLIKLGLLTYRKELDEDKMIIRKIYRTKDDITICIGRELLEKIAYEIAGER